LRGGTLKQHAAALGFSAQYESFGFRKLLLNPRNRLPGCEKDPGVKVPTLFGAFIDLAHLLVSQELDHLIQAQTWTASRFVTRSIVFFIGVSNFAEFPSSQQGAAITAVCIVTVQASSDCEGPVLWYRLSLLVAGKADLWLWH
jgi:hypothetical protein